MNTAIYLHVPISTFKTITGSARLTRILWHLAWADSIASNVDRERISFEKVTTNSD